MCMQDVLAGRGHGDRLDAASGLLVNSDPDSIALRGLLRKKDGEVLWRPLELYVVRKSHVGRGGVKAAFATDANAHREIKGISKENHGDFAPISSEAPGGSHALSDFRLGGLKPRFTPHSFQS